jgi:hypothetical protein
VLADYLALERARKLRRLLVVRLSLLAAGVVLGEWFLHLSPWARVVSFGVCLLPALAVCVLEWRLEWRLARRLAAIPETGSASSAPVRPEKVIKSS